MPLPGLGWSSPVVADGRVWVTTAVEQRGVSLRAIAFDAATGREVVNVEVFNDPGDRRDINPKNSWASPTPIDRRRSRLRALRRRWHGRAVDRRAR